MYKKIGARVREEYHEQIKQFCEKNGITQSDLFLDGIALMMGRDARVYERVNELTTDVRELNEELATLKSRGFWARLTNKGVKKNG